MLRWAGTLRWCLAAAPRLVSAYNCIYPVKPPWHVSPGLATRHAVHWQVPVSCSFDVFYVYLDMYLVHGHTSESRQVDMLPPVMSVVRHLLHASPTVYNLPK